MDRYDQIKNNMNRLYAAAVHRGLITEEIRTIHGETRILVEEYAQEQGIDVLGTAVLKYRRQKGSDPKKCALNHKDMLTGCLNRMAVSDDETERRGMFTSALYHVDAEAMEALEAAGAITVPEFEWKCPLKL